MAVLSMTICFCVPAYWWTWGWRSGWQQPTLLCGQGSVSPEPPGSHHREYPEGNTDGKCQDRVGHTHTVNSSCVLLQTYTLVLYFLSHTHTPVSSGCSWLPWCWTAVCTPLWWHTSSRSSSWSWTPSLERPPPSLPPSINVTRSVKLSYDTLSTTASSVQSLCCQPLTVRLLAAASSLLWF